MEHTIVRPPSAIRRKSEMHCEQDRSSSPVVGSSKNITGGLLTNSKAMDNRFISPPDSSWHIVWFDLVSRRRSKISSIWWTRKVSGVKLFRQQLYSPHHLPLHSFAMSSNHFLVLGALTPSSLRGPLSVADANPTAWCNATFSGSVSCFSVGRWWEHCQMPHWFYRVYWIRIFCGQKLKTSQAYTYLKPAKTFSKVLLPAPDGPI